MVRRKSTTEITVRVSLKGRRVWRVIALRGDQTLEDLHEAIFAAFNRSDDHLYSFYFPKAPRRRGPVVPVKEYVAPVSFKDSWGTRRRFDAASTALDDLGLKIGERCEYLFDYGDCWWHDIVVEAVGQVLPGRKYPFLLEEHGPSPRQYRDSE
jgi:hypothetical protein